MLRTTKKRPSTLVSLVRFGLLALVPVVALGIVLARVINADVQQRYLDSSETSAKLIAQVGIQPLLTSQQLSGGGLNAAEVGQLEARLQGAEVSDEVVRIKVWNPGGTIVYSDNHALIGRTFPIDDDLGDALKGTSKASITDGHDEENSGDNLQGPLVQVYVPLRFSAGSATSGAFELYLPYAPVQAAIDHESRQLYVLLAVGLTLFYASMFPVALIADRWRKRAETTAMANLAVLERLNRMKSEFLVRISHQFRTSLVGIEGFSEVIRDADRLDLDEVKAFANDIYNDAERLQQAFTEMVELDEMESGRTALEMTRTNLNQLISGVVDKARIDNPGRTILTILGPSLPDVSCDSNRITQVVANLLDNAVKYSRRGAEVAVAAGQDGDVVKVTVTDHGPGMPPDFDQTLFVGRSNGSGGTGLGLPIARQIIEMHGGKIWFDSRIGQGSEFHFTLPLKLRPTTGMKAVAHSA
ncbi:MAG TPA: HAMP domain-containing sensor histidine kinase [Candidatus Dormibacteraeota bacterium]|nr:HAMP domain-containing sensor histidine kinase [Candidatus Dormibacteraeota bacterium]